MKNYVLLLLALTVSSISINGQTLLSYEHVADLTTDQLDSLAGQSGEFGVSLYTMIYTMENESQGLDTVSGLAGFPIDPTFETPLVIYCHGTTDGPTDAPSLLGSGFAETLAFTSSGFATSTPDYLGLGIAARSFHPYIHAETEALATVWSIQAINELAAAINFENTSSMSFVAGYSQGAHASTALQDKIESEFVGQFDLTAAAHGSGPYSVSGVMKDLITESTFYLPIGFLPYNILGYQTAYGDLYTELDEIFKPQFVPLIEQFEEGTLGLAGVSQQMAFILISNFLPVAPQFLLQDSILTRLRADDPDDLMIQYLRENDTYNFTPMVPTRLYYCEADDVVPFENSILADSIFQSNGANDLELVHVNPNAGHGACAVEMIPMAIDFFLSFLPSDVTYTQSELSNNIYPNPVQEMMTINLKPEYQDVSYEIRNTHGKLIEVGRLKSEINELNLHRYTPGLYTIQLFTGNQYEVKTFIKA